MNFVITSFHYASSPSFTGSVSSRACFRASFLLHILTSIFGLQLLVVWFYFLFHMFSCVSLTTFLKALASSSWRRSGTSQRLECAAGHSVTDSESLTRCDPPGDGRAQAVDPKRYPPSERLQTLAPPEDGRAQAVDPKHYPPSERLQTLAPPEDGRAQAVDLWLFPFLWGVLFLWPQSAGAAGSFRNRYPSSSRTAASGHVRGHRVLGVPLHRH